MERKTDCENVVLSASEKKLLKEIAAHPHEKCEFEDIRALINMGLVDWDYIFNDKTREYEPLGTCCVTPFYQVYREYRKDRFRELSLQSLWLPIVVSIITNLTVDVLQWLWPLIAR
nr:MAG TPA: hypothetical protein [Caudoviricetes sp.]